MFDTVNKGKRNGNGSHFVITCDETGIFEAFYAIKDRLAAGRGTDFISLIYTVSDKNLHPFFKQELNILEKRFSDFLIVHISRIDTKKYYIKQELIEATINSNTLPKMKFLVFGNTEFVNYVSRVLRFLDVKEFMIDLKIA
jgi:ferredoxin-NADP reductase